MSGPDGSARGRFWDGRLPQAFITPRMIAGMLRREVDGRTRCISFEQRGDNTFACAVAVEETFDHAKAILIRKDRPLAYVRRGDEFLKVGFIVDQPPAVFTPHGQMQAAKFSFLAIDRPTGALASNPGCLPVSFEKLAQLHPELLGETAPKESMGMIARVVRGLLFGDTQPAFVVSTSPELVIAAYSCDMDCVAMVRFDQSFVGTYSLSVGERMTSVNTYGKSGQIAPDLNPGPRYSQSWTNFQPRIAEFMTDDIARLSTLHASISEKEWELAQKALERSQGQSRLKIRDGRPLKSADPAQ